MNLTDLKSRIETLEGYDTVTLQVHEVLAMIEVIERSKQVIVALFYSTDVEKLCAAGNVEKLRSALKQLETV